MNGLAVVLKKRVLVLLSGGIDSAVCATKLCTDGNDVYALSIRYPNSANAEEIDNAIFHAKRLHIKHVVVDFNFIEQLTVGVDANMSFNVGGAINNCISRGKVPMPMSVELLHVVALMFARMREIRHIYWSIHKDDIVGDSEKKIFEYLRALEGPATLGRYSSCKFELPFIGFSKKEVIEIGESLDVNFDHTHSCSSSSRVACGVCRQCVLRADAFESLHPKKLAG
ncbi:MAG: 7-cyano-7-deazaguanine synthase [Parcubacteria group bacterium GW2011_GWC1_42_11]|uniref:7-cyano-7-deazaguanine synthase n=1 Tax=Candidatus Nomurabacteria bacterium GW2011_GWC2_42_20 TaxID=1618756 RepID=A0A0G0ZE03_9BACT|nr:MAG: 7-cyano-7-deazaguanine synthase [Parcubacteria group bacterium GW2011_GWC1_42_11]KKS46914.1 MAG: 7-cyano-7-deazaguanine synthase [Candidatus Nomurabacteria bacterium GW2011_GWC2_42_20]KKS58919.1 MAG: 7-cyano-7-deazaguanine synthase [Candidatus Nomurabacteria bacterium GW2011_GWA2_42_41]KKT08131.1 MAG: 7-cyano-7-deazaguanine synthase [Candidatus Nomurabacteria bacterium GW2011_GWB1_43_20]